MAEYLSIPGYLPASEAAARLGFSTERLLQHVRARHIQARKVSGRYMIAENALAAFERKPHGRTRQKATRWKHYRAGASVWMLSIDVDAFPEHVDLLQQRLESLETTQRHVFAGTMHRFISLDDRHMTISLLWKDTDLPDETTLFADLECFKHDFADVLDWNTAQIKKMKAVAYT